MYGNVKISPFYNICRANVINQLWYLVSMHSLEKLSGRSNLCCYEKNSVRLLSQKPNIFFGMCCAGTVLIELKCWKNMSLRALKNWHSVTAIVISIRVTDNQRIDYEN